MAITPEQQSVEDQLTAWIAGEIQAGRSDAEIIGDLRAQGWTESDAAAAVRGGRNSSQSRLSVPLTQPQPSRPSYDAKAERRAAGRRKIIIGCCWFFGGLVVTIVTYTAAANNPGGGTYVVAWGAIAFGAFDIIQGLVMQA